jgi:hypothetical protein
MTAADDSVKLLLQAVLDGQKETREILIRHIETEPAEWAAALRVLMNDSFPEGDAIGHRKAHEAQIKAFEDRAEFWKKMLFELTKWGLIGFLTWILFSAVVPAIVTAVRGH